MKKFLLFTFSLLTCLCFFVEANNNWTIEKIWDDIVLSNGEKSITIKATNQQGKNKAWTWNWDKWESWEQWVCDQWYHIPTKDEWLDLLNLWYDIKWNELGNIEKTKDWLNQSNIDNYDSKMAINFSDDLSMAAVWEWSAWKNSVRDIWLYWSSTYDSKNQMLYSLKFDKYWNSIKVWFNCWLACSIAIRCFKDDKVNSKYSKDYNDAYSFAYENKITTMPTIEEANMTWEIIRAEIAKMFSNWMKSLGYEPNTQKKCKFSDTKSVQWDLAPAIIESCQFGVMWQWITKFRPFDKITKWEVATAVSRIIRWDKYNWWEPFYVNHINALIQEWVIDNTGNVNENELRWNVMLMLMKANEVIKNNKDN